MIVHSCILSDQVKYIVIKEELTTSSRQNLKKNQKKNTTIKQLIILDFLSSIIPSHIKIIDYLMS